MWKISSYAAAVCSGCVVVILFSVFCLVSVSSINAQDEFEETVYKLEFKVQKYSAVSAAGVRTTQLGIYTRGDEKANFSHENSSYQLHTIHTTGKEVVLDLVPTGPDALSLRQRDRVFPPSGKDLGYRIYVGSVGNRVSSNTKVFDFPDAATPHILRHTWRGSVGWKEGDSAVIRIVKLDIESFASNLQFASSRPTPTKNSGRLEIVQEPDNDVTIEKRWRICSKGFGAEEAQVVCRQMGLEANGARAMNLSKTNWLKIRSDPLHSLLDTIEVANILRTPAGLENIECEGHEAKLVDCKHLGINIFRWSICPVEDTAAVICGG